jgi:hypothetical protein
LHILPFQQRERPDFGAVLGGGAILDPRFAGDIEFLESGKNIAADGHRGRGAPEVSTISREGHKPDRERAAIISHAAPAMQSTAAAGYNFRRLLAWFSLLLSAIWTALSALGRSQTFAAAA